MAFSKGVKENMSERYTMGFGEKDVEMFGFDALEAVARSAGSGDPDEMADYLEKHGDAAIGDYVNIGIENAGRGCLFFLLGGLIDLDN